MPKVFRGYTTVAVLLVWCLSARSQTPARSSPEKDKPLAAQSSAPLPVDQVVKKLQERNAERAAALDQYEATRVYRMQYKGFPSNREAEMVVEMTYHAPNSKQFKIVSQKGSKIIIDRVFNKLLEAELEAANEENRRHSALTTDNYDFTLAGYEAAEKGAEYVLNIVPKTKNKFLYRGQIWVDAKDFAVVRIKGEPGKNPSFWIKKTDIEHRYTKVNNFWLPAENHTESVIRLGGVAVLSIEYKDYRDLKAEPLRDAAPAATAAAR
jgi:outer membrane lipoprotein-sorting protein